METKKQELKVEIIAVPDLSLIPKDIIDTMIAALEIEINVAISDKEK